jgi:Ran GTPase-activating protein (RanGAP) involved in mRNA processing and transport
VWTCGLDAAAFAALLAVLPRDLAALNAGGNDLSRIGRPSAATHLKNRLWEASSISRRSTAKAGDTNSSISSGGSTAPIEADLTPLARLTALQELRLRRCNLSGLAALTLSPNVASLPALTAVDFSFNPMGKSGTKAVLSALAAAGAPISELRLDGVKSPNGSFTPGIQGVLAELGPAIPGSLLTLSFSDCNLESNAAAAIADFLGSAPQLQSLDISRNSIGARGATKVAAALGKSGEIRVVSLGHNNIGNAGTCAIVESLSQCPHLECLDLEAVGLTGTAVLTCSQVRTPQRVQECVCILIP